VAIHQKALKKISQDLEKMVALRHMSFSAISLSTSI